MVSGASHAYFGTVLIEHPILDSYRPHSPKAHRMQKPATEHKLPPTGLTFKDFEDAKATADLVAPRARHELAAYIGGGFFAGALISILTATLLGHDTDDGHVKQVISWVVLICSVLPAIPPYLQNRAHSRVLIEQLERARTLNRQEQEQSSSTDDGEDTRN